jgi:RNA polymerase sigma-70 factor (ECF subfamily)
VDFDDSLLRREPDGAEALVVPKMQNGDPLKALNRKELRGQIKKAFESLSEKHRAVLLLREVEGLSYDEIARALKIHKGTVMSRLHHARRNLQRALRSYLQSRGDKPRSQDPKPQGSKAQKATDRPGG